MLQEGLLFFLELPPNRMVCGSFLFSIFHITRTSSYSQAFTSCRSFGSPTPSHKIVYFNFAYIIKLSKPIHSAKQLPVFRSPTRVATLFKAFRIGNFILRHNAINEYEYNVKESQIYRIARNWNLKKEPRTYRRSWWSDHSLSLSLLSERSFFYAPPINNDSWLLLCLVWRQILKKKSEIVGGLIFLPGSDFSLLAPMTRSCILRSPRVGWVRFPMLLARRLRRSVQSLRKT